MSVGSDLEKADLKKAYLNCKGCINQMMNCIPFMAVEDEPRFQDIVKGKRCTICISCGSH